MTKPATKSATMQRAYACVACRAGVRPSEGVRIMLVFAVTNGPEDIGQEVRVTRYACCKLCYDFAFTKMRPPQMENIAEAVGRYGHLLDVEARWE